MEFILIPTGEFIMGAVPQDKDSEYDEKPKHKVRITKPFYMGKYPVTQEEWEKLDWDNPSTFKNAGKRAPVESVSWYGCQEFIKKLNHKEGKCYRLPREAEWEYAARGGTLIDLTSGTSRSTLTRNSIYTFGDDTSKLGDYAWYDDNSNYITHAVGDKKPNEWGLYDMMGNVWEWCEDLYHDEYYKSTILEDPEGPKKGEVRVLRGGSYFGYARECRLSNRRNDSPDYRYNFNGFRLVLLP